MNTVSAFSAADVNGHVRRCKPPLSSATAAVTANAGSAMPLWVRSRR